MTNETKPPTMQHVILFVCSGCEACRQATTYLRGWANGCPDVFVEIISILDQPEKIIRLGISQTPALVIEGKTLAQNLTVDELARFLLNQPGGNETGL